MRAIAVVMMMAYPAVALVGVRPRGHARNGPLTAENGDIMASLRERATELKLDVPGKITACACACKSGLSYAECCEPLHTSAAARDAAGPLAVLRARYTAYVERQPDFIMDTTHADNEEWIADREEWRASILGFALAATMVDLNVYWQEEVGDDEYVITWNARVRVLDNYVAAEFVETKDFFERSIFVREDSKWWYQKSDPDFESKNIRVSGPLDPAPKPEKPKPKKKTSAGKQVATGRR